LLEQFHGYLLAPNVRRLSLSPPPPGVRGGRKEKTPP
jgi:hypothetical protein